jgi:hypothetical protein
MIPYIGPAKSLLGSVMFYISIIQFVLIAVVFYHTTLSPWAAQHAPWLTLWVFVGVLSAIFLIALVVEFKFMMASVISFGNVQGYTHGNPFVRDLQKALSELKDIKDKLEAKK